MLITVQNISSSPLSTDVGLLAPAETKSMRMGPNAAYRAAEGLNTLVAAGKVVVTVAEESDKLDSLEPAAVGTAAAADGTITTVKLANLAVTSAKLASAAVTAGKIAVGGVSAANQFAAGVVDSTALASAAVAAGKIAVGGVSAANQFAAGVVDSTALASAAVTAGKIAVGGVSAANQFAAGVVNTAALASATVTAAKVPVFVSAEQTGTGASQNVPHGLTGTPSLVLVSVTEDPAGSGFDVAEGTHDGTNVVVTVTTGVKFKVLAWI